MERTAFLEGIAEVLEVEVDEINFSTDFRREVPDFDSLKGFAMIVFFEDEYNKEVTVKQFLQAKTIEDLYQFVAE